MQLYVSVGSYIRRDSTEDIVYNRTRWVRFESGILTCINLIFLIAAISIFLFRQFALLLIFQYRLINQRAGVPILVNVEDHSKEFKKVVALTSILSRNRPQIRLKNGQLGSRKPWRN